MINILKKLFDRKLLKFFLIGCLNSIIRAGGMFIFYNCFEVSYWISTAVNYVIGGFISFFLNKYYTFNDRSKSFYQFLAFVVTLVGCYILGYVFTKWAIYKIFINSSESFKDNLSMIAGFCIYSVVNYVIQRLVIFKDSDHAKEIKNIINPKKDND